MFLKKNTEKNFKRVGNYKVNETKEKEREKEKEE